MRRPRELFRMASEVVRDGCLGRLSSLCCESAPGPILMIHP